ncbi:Protein of unknown function [Gryllus bimaculatus]|nr:Protein of unknown function [Gryllus bimaculatus]
MTDWAQLEVPHLSFVMYLFLKVSNGNIPLLH